ncbi:MAG TPA: lipoate--protein ligase family protein [Pirellulales bacterium]|nr:lipoate--protein ligase family protein [Pirellulales bacterium]
MRLLELTLPTPEENLALDEALLDAAEEIAERGGGQPCESLRLWEPARPLVVIGRSSSVAAEVNADFCRREGVPILRRSSGGAAIVSGPGCLMYAVVLNLELRPALRAIDAAHAFVLGTLAAALRRHGLAAEQCGISDLAIGGLKFSGNSMRVRRSHLLYHGTLLYDFPLPLIASCLRLPLRQPDYRAGRAHEAFVTNLPVPAEKLRAIAKTAWPVSGVATDWPAHRVVELVDTKYSRPEWNDRTR